MAFLVVTTQDPARLDERENVRPAHLAYLDANMHLLLAAGARLSDDGAVALGSAYILDVESREDAEAFIAAEPYCRAGILAAVEITRWRKAIFQYRRDT